VLAAGGAAAAGAGVPFPKLNPEIEGCGTEGNADGSSFFGMADIPKVDCDGVAGGWT